MNLYELNQTYESILALICSGEATEEDMQAALDQVQDDTEVKLEAYGKIIRQLEADALGLKDEEARLADKRRQAERSARYMKERVKEALDLRGGDRKLKTPLFSFWVQKNPPALEVDLAAKNLPEYYQLHEIKPNSKAIKEALKRGQDIEGCRLVQGESLRMK